MMINLFKPILWCWRLSNVLKYSGCWSINWVIITSDTDSFYDNYYLIKRLKSMPHYMWKSTWKWKHAQIVSPLFVKGRSSLYMVFYKKPSVKISQKFKSLLTCLEPVTVTKKIPTQVVSCEFRQIVQKTFFEEYFRATASESTFQGTLLKVWSTW